MRKEKAAVDVMWVSICISPFMMTSMVTTPFNNIILKIKLFFFS